MSFDLELTGRRAFVTGGTKGIGAAVVQSLRQADGNPYQRDLRSSPV